MKSLKQFAAGFAFLGLLSLTPAQAQTNFATLAPDGAWTWFNDPRAIFHNGKLYFGYVRAGDGKTALSVFDLQTGVASNLFASSYSELDDHNNPGLLVKQDGRLLAVYSRHSSDQYFYYRSSLTTNPVSPADWSAEQTNAKSGAWMSYANPYQLASESGKIYNFCRDLNWNPTVLTSTNGGATWSAPQLMIKTGTGSVRPYVKYCSDYQSRMDVLYTDAHPDAQPTSLYHMYYQGGAFYQTDGTFLTHYANLPLLHDSGQRGSVVYQYNTNASSYPNQWIANARAWCWETAYQTNGAPVCVFQTKVDAVTGTNWSDARIYYYYARWTGTNWQKRFIAQAGRPLYDGQPDYGGGIALDPQNANTIYISSDAVNPFDVSTTTKVPLGAHYEIYKGVTTNGWQAFNWTAMTTNSTVDNCRPYVPRRFGGEPCVLWWRGTYANYTSFSTSIVGIFTTAVPTPTNATSTTPGSCYYVDATDGPGGNTTLANGSAFTGPVNTYVTNSWNKRTPFASSGTIFADGDTAVTDAPELCTTITGLVPGANYSIYALFWNTTLSSDYWSLRAGFTSAPGANPLYSAAASTTALGSIAAPLATNLNFAVPPTLLTEGNRVMFAAPLGTNTADANGSIRVFIDDLPSTAGAHYRTWYDGLAYQFVTGTDPTNLLVTVAGDHLTLSWPANHAGWTLQTQTNPLATGLSMATNAWLDLPGTASVTATNLLLNPTSSAVFYRLKLAL